MGLVAAALASKHRNAISRKMKASGRIIQFVNHQKITVILRFSLNLKDDFIKVESVQAPVVPPLFEMHGVLAHNVPTEPNGRFYRHLGGIFVIPIANGHSDIVMGSLGVPDRHARISGRVVGPNLRAFTRKFPTFVEHKCCRNKTTDR